MGNIIKVIIGESDGTLKNPKEIPHIRFEVDAYNKEEYRRFLDVVEFFCEKGFDVHTSTEEGHSLNLTRAYNDFKECEKRNLDG